MVEYLELFKGDDTDFSLNQAICIKLVTDYDLAGCTAHVKFYDYEQTFYPIVDKKLPLSFPGSVTSKFPLGRGSAKIWLTEPNPEGAGTRQRTVANDLKILVTNNIDLLSRKDISYTLLLRYNYNDLDSKPMLNGRTIEGDHKADYYGLEGLTVDEEMSETSENPVQNKVIATKFKTTDKSISDHVNQKSGNPHNVGKSDVGLGNVDNTSDTDKPVSTAQAKAIKGVSDGLDKEAKRASEAEEELGEALESAGEAIENLAEAIKPVAPALDADESALAGAKATAEYFKTATDNKQDQIWVESSGGDWIVDGDFPQPLVENANFSYVNDDREGKTGKVWRLNGLIGGSAYLWYGPKEETALTGNFVDEMGLVPDIIASRIIRIQPRAEGTLQDYTISRNRLATVGAVLKAIATLKGEISNIVADLVRSGTLKLKVNPDGKVVVDE